jgi:hypothetical protein
MNERRTYANKIANRWFFSVLAQLIIKGIVSRYWGRLQIVLLDRLEFPELSLDIYFYFSLKLHFKNKCFQNGGCPGML